MNRTKMLCLALGLLAGCSSTGEKSSGAYVEARTASVFAGACHYGAEYTTAGREAVLAWNFDAGAARGADVVAVVRSGQNLAEEASDRRSVLYLNGPEAACDLAVELLNAKGVLGEVVAIEDGAEVRVEGDRYHVRAGGGVELSGALLPDRACCSMPSNVWYAPLSEDQGMVVGNSEVFRCDVPALDIQFACSGENDAFVGSFTW